MAFTCSDIIKVVTSVILWSIFTDIDADFVRPSVHLHASCSQCERYSFAVIIPPVGVLLERGCGADFWYVIKAFIFFGDVT